MSNIEIYDVPATGEITRSIRGEPEENTASVTPPPSTNDDDGLVNWVQGNRIEFVMAVKNEALVGADGMTKAMYMAGLDKLADTAIKRMNLKKEQGAADPKMIDAIAKQVLRNAAQNPQPQGLGQIPTPPSGKLSNQEVPASMLTFADNQEDHRAFQKRTVNLDIIDMDD